MHGAGNIKIFASQPFSQKQFIIIHQKQKVLKKKNIRR